MIDFVVSWESLAPPKTSHWCDYALSFAWGVRLVGNRGKCRRMLCGLLKNSGAKEAKVQCRKPSSMLDWSQRKKKTAYTKNVRLQIICLGSGLRCRFRRLIRNVRGLMGLSGRTTAKNSLVCPTTTSLVCAAGNAESQTRRPPKHFFVSPSNPLPVVSRNVQPSEIRPPNRPARNKGQVKIT